MRIQQLREGTQVVGCAKKMWWGFVLLPSPWAKVAFAKGFSWLLSSFSHSVAQRVLKAKRHVLSVSGENYPLEVTAYPTELNPNEVKDWRAWRWVGFGMQSMVCPWKYRTWLTGGMAELFRTSFAFMFMGRKDRCGDLHWDSSLLLVLLLNNG